ncbi:hypothetical protein DUNSADRAFT_1307 [Dunaliella salina]|uniref:Uncharacterized protein n=1 Tax=Dunaliella salina TaxID=3046 RepID=A0ABQ7FXP6_DUNSA|nr:hypothetical protein DUNSADRAFT_1307 [Dunaliella salina]|eukprot:KAF5827119.1 hypothetical protein DUNSADRAFT_1307 [Dunaliella salina]
MEEAKGGTWADMAALNSKDPTVLEENDHRTTPRGLVFSYAGPQALQQARMEAMQIRVKERLLATLMKNKDHGYTGLETCDYDHNDLAKDASGNTSASLFPKPKDMEGSIEQFRSLIVPPALSRKGEVLASSAKYVTDGHPGRFQHSSKGSPRLDNPKSVSTSFHISGQDQDKDPGSPGANTEEAERQRSSRKQVMPRQRQRAPGGAGTQEHSRGDPGGATKSSTAQAAANGSENGNSRVKHKVDAKLLKTLKSSVAAPYVPVTIASGVVPSRGLSTTAGVIGAVKKKVVDNGAILRPLSAHAADTPETRTLQTGPQTANAKERMSYVGGSDIQLPLGLGSRHARAKAEEDAKLSVPLVKVEEVDIVQESKRRATAQLLGQQQQQALQSPARPPGSKGQKASPDREANSTKVEAGLYEPIDFETLANSSQAAVAALLQGLIPPEVQPPVPGFEGSRQQAHTDRGGQPQLSHRASHAPSQLSHRESQSQSQLSHRSSLALSQSSRQDSHAQSPASRQLREGLEDSLRSRGDQQEQQQQQRQQQELHQHQRQKQPEGNLGQRHPMHSHQLHLHTHHAAAALPHPSHSQLYAHEPALHEQLPPQRPWPSPQPHQHPAHDSSPAQHLTHHPSFPRPTSTSASRPQSPPWHLASAQLPSRQPSSSRSSPLSRTSSPRRRSAPAPAPTHTLNHNLSVGAHSLEPPAPTSFAPPFTSPTHAWPTSARPSITKVRPTSASPSTSPLASGAHARHVPARPMSASPIPQHPHASKHLASASAATPSRRPWRPSSPHHSTSGAWNTTAAAVHAAQGSGSEEGTELMYSWQLRGNPSHRHGTPTAYQMHAAPSTPAAAPTPWASPSIEPAPAALPWPINRPVSATSGPARRTSSTSLIQTSNSTLTSPRESGMEPPSSEARIAMIRQQQQHAPWPKVANRDRDPAYAMARAAHPPLNSTPRFPFSPPPGAPSSAYPTPQPWAADTTPEKTAPLPSTASTPSNLGATAASVVSSPAVSHCKPASSLGQTVGVGRRGGGLASNRPASASMATLHEHADSGGVIHGVPTALQKLELPLQTEQVSVSKTDPPSSTHSTSPFKSRPLSAAPAPAVLHHQGSLRHSSPSTQRPLSASPHLALDRPSPTQTRAHKATGQDVLAQPAIPHPRSGGPRAEMQMAPGGATMRSRPQSAMALSPSGVPSKRARPPTAGLWGSSGSG